MRLYESGYSMKHDIFHISGQSFLLSWLLVPYGTGSHPTSSKKGKMCART
jgi:hypothetical protein